MKVNIFDINSNGEAVPSHAEVSFKEYQWLKDFDDNQKAETALWPLALHAIYFAKSITRNQKSIDRY